MPVFIAKDLCRLGANLFQAVGSPSEDAWLVSDHMVERKEEIYLVSPTAGRRQPEHDRRIESIDSRNALALYSRRGEYTVLDRKLRGHLVCLSV